MFEIYRKAFLDNNVAIYWGGETRNRYWDDSTLLIYFFIIFTMIVYGCVIEKKKHRKSRPEPITCEINSTMRSTEIKRRINIKSKTFNSFRLYYPLAILLFFMGLRGSWVGMDTIVYSQTFENASSIQQIFSESTTEPLYKLLQLGLRMIISSRYLAIFFYSSLIIYFYSRVLKIYYHKINILIALLTFACIYYFQSYNLMRITVASTFVCSHFDLLIRHKYKQYCGVVLLATFFHYSTIVAFLPFGVYFIYKRNKLLAVSLLGLIAVLTIYSTKIFDSYIMLIDRYSTYVMDNGSERKVGVMLFFEYLPCLYLVFYIWKNKINGVWADLTVSYTLTGFLIRMVAYYILAAGRLGYHFMPLTVILLPYWLSTIKGRDKKQYRVILILTLSWLALRLHMYFLDCLSVDGIMPYYFFWNEL